MPTNLTSAPVGFPLGIFAESTSADLIQLGVKAYADDGRAYRWCKAGELLEVGKLQQSPVEDTAHQGLTPTAAAAAGATSVSLTLGASATTANEYAQGYLIVTVTPGVAYIYKIKSHAAAASSGTQVLTLSDPIEVATTTTSRFDMVLNPYAGVIVNPVTATGLAAGAAVNNIASGSFGWLQVAGVCSLLGDGAIVVGTGVVASNGIAGAIEDVASTTQAVVGTAQTGIADTEYGAVHLLLN